jgi:hypothetical protein
MVSLFILQIYVFSPQTKISFVYCSDSPKSNNHTPTLKLILRSYFRLSAHTPRPSPLLAPAVGYPLLPGLGFTTSYSLFINKKMEFWKAGNHHGLKIKITPETEVITALNLLSYMKMNDVCLLSQR